LPIKKIAGREDFDYWYGEHYNSTSAPDDPAVWVPWTRRRKVCRRFSFRRV